MSFGYLLLRPFAVLIYHTGIKKSNERVHKMETDMALSWLSELGKRVFGSMDGLFYTLVAFVVIDYITGVCVAIHNKRLSSDVGAHGIAKKIAIFALVSLSSIIDRFLLPWYFSKWDRKFCSFCGSGNPTFPTFSNMLIASLAM